ncbi:hypothetical protein [Cellulomonas sp. ATA003]|uniref:hypothetical protein n=1 Tax=Cellulomonas sp. ATA003 TaxID=3073064 RepID=UPI002872D020|nr:hypothetical protein [Cellulomonas sp. ATA003]WNB86643.1 hypothetical protein REH70_05275 [Cellulomonas sp. ATA003]
MTDAPVDRGAAGLRPPSLRRGDPLAKLRASQDAELDVLLSGPVFFDIVFTDLPQEPAPGTEVWAGGMGSSPGGISNLAVAASRLGLRTGLAAGFGDDVYGNWCWDVLGEQEGIDLRYSRRIPGWHSAVTVSVATRGDRSMITHGHPVPFAADELMTPPPRVRAALVELTAAGHGPAPGGARWRPRAPSCSPTSAGTTPARGTWRRWTRWPTATPSRPTWSRRWPTRVRTPRRRRSTCWPSGCRSRS